MLAQTVFWIAILIPFYAYIGYPLVLLALRLLIRREVKKGPIQPFISLLIPAYNEDDVIARKIRLDSRFVPRCGNPPSGGVAPGLPALGRHPLMPFQGGATITSP